MAECKHHVDHENRISRLEENMDKVQETLSGNKLGIALIGLMGIMFSTAGSVIGTILGIYLKSRGAI